MRDKGFYETILLISSWTGNFILTLLAFFLAFGNKEPLSAQLFATVALCVLGGNALPISVYLIQLWWRKAEIAGEERIATQKLREVLMEANDIEERLHEVHDASAKAILVGRQIPDRIAEKVQALESMLTKLQSSELDDVIRNMQGTISASESVRRRIAEMEKTFTSRMSELESSVQVVAAQMSRMQVEDSSSTNLIEHISQIAKQIEGLEGQISELKSKSGNEDDSSDSEWKESLWQRLDLITESIESLEERTTIQPEGHLSKDDDDEGDEVDEVVLPQKSEPVDEVAPVTPFDDQSIEPEEDLETIENNGEDGFKVLSSENDEEDQELSDGASSIDFEDWVDEPEESEDVSFLPDEDLDDESPEDPIEEDRLTELDIDTDESTISETEASETEVVELKSPELEEPQSDEPQLEVEDSSPDELENAPDDLFESNEVVSPEETPKSKSNDTQSELELPIQSVSHDPTRTVIKVHAMIGIANKITMRGDGPHLSWDKGTPLELVGIGEYQWECENLEETISVKLLLNDREWAEGENIELHPGETLRVQPVFAGKRM